MKSLLVLLVVMVIGIGIYTMAPLGSESVLTKDLLPESVASQIPDSSAAPGSSLERTSTAVAAAQYVTGLHQKRQEEQQKEQEQLLNNLP